MFDRRLYLLHGTLVYDGSALVGVKQSDPEPAQSAALQQSVQQFRVIWASVKRDATLLAVDEATVPQLRKYLWIAGHPPGATLFLRTLYSIVTASLPLCNVEISRGGSRSNHST